MSASPDNPRPQLSDPQIELAARERAEQLRRELLAMNEAQRTGILHDVSGELARLHGEPIKRGSDRWVFVTEHCVYKIPSPQSFGGGLSGIFASVAEGAAGEMNEPGLAACRLVHTPDGVPVVIQERVEITGPEIADDDSIGINSAGERVSYDRGGLGL